MAGRAYSEENIDQLQELARNPNQCLRIFLVAIVLGVVITACLLPFGQGPRRSSIEPLFTNNQDSKRNEGNS